MSLEEREQKYFLYIAIVGIIAALLMWFFGLVWTQLLFGPYL